MYVMCNIRQGKPERLFRVHSSCLHTLADSFVQWKAQLECRQLLCSGNPSWSAKGMQQANEDWEQQMQE